MKSLEDNSSGGGGGGGVGGVGGGGGGDNEGEWLEVALFGLTSRGRRPAGVRRRRRHRKTDVPLTLMIRRSSQKVERGTVGLVTQFSSAIVHSVTTSLLKTDRQIRFLGVNCRKNADKIEDKID